MAYALFLDDDHDRHAHFRLFVASRGFLEHQVLHVYTAADAIAALRTYEGEITEAFLDHDLCEDDHWVAPGAPSKVPTGMAVVDHITTMRRPPGRVTVHSFNQLAAVEMCARLAAVKTITVERIPFPLLLGRLA
jgi:hypothetical protein